MKKVICLPGMALALVSLAGCGLKGPLYFPPAEPQSRPSPQTPEQQKQASDADVGGLVTGSDSGMSH